VTKEGKKNNNEKNDDGSVFFFFLFFLRHTTPPLTFTNQIVQENSPDSGYSSQFPGKKRAET